MPNSYQHNCHPSNRGVLNTFTNLKATQEQAHDMLAFRSIEEALDVYIKHVIIGEPSTSSVIRHRKLLTMASVKTTRRKLLTMASVKWKISQK